MELIKMVNPCGKEKFFSPQGKWLSKYWNDMGNQCYPIENKCHVILLLKSTGSYQPKQIRHATLLSLKLS